MSTRRRSGIEFALWLALAHLSAAAAIVFVLSALSQLVVWVAPPAWLLGFLSIACLVGIFVDLRAIKRQGLSVGLRRQTPKALLHIGEHAWITPVIWGFDTGLIWTTYRVSFTSWLLLLMAFAGVAPAWAGAVYGIVFAVPLLALLLVPPRHFPRSAMSSLIPAQVVGVASMIVMVLLASRALVGSV